MRKKECWFNRKTSNIIIRSVALATAAVTVIAASATSAKAEGNSNIPNPTNIEEQTNAPIPSAGEDVIVADEIKNEIIDKGTWINDSYNYTTREHGKFARRSPQVDNNIGRTSAIFHFPYNDKELFDFWVENGFLSIDGDELVDFRMEDGSILSLDIDGLQENFYLTKFEMFGETIVEAFKNYAVACKKAGKEPTVEEAMTQVPDYSKLYPEKLQSAYKQSLEWFLDILINGLNPKSKSFSSLMKSTIDIGSKDELNKLIYNKMAGMVRGIERSKLKLYERIYQSDDAPDRWKISIIFAKEIENMFFDNLTDTSNYPIEVIETAFKKDEKTNKWVFYKQPYHISATDNKPPIYTDFEYFCGLYRLIEDFKMESMKYLRDYTFAEGTKYRALWENGGIEDFDESLYINSSVNK